MRTVGRWVGKRPRDEWRRPRIAPMHPFLRSLIIAIVGVIVAGGLVALALLGQNSDMTVVELVLAGVVAALVGAFLFVQGWRWSQRSWNAGASGVAVLIAITGGIAGVVAAGALAGVVIMAFLFLVS